MDSPGIWVIADIPNTQLWVFGTKGGKFGFLREIWDTAPTELPAFMEPASHGGSVSQASLGRRDRGVSPPQVGRGTER